MFQVQIFIAAQPEKPFPSLGQLPREKDHGNDAGDPPQGETVLGFGFGVIIFETLPFHLLKIM